MFNWIYDLFDEATVKAILMWVEFFFVLYLLGYASFLFASMLTGSSEIFDDIKKRRLHHTIQHAYCVPISILVPAHNEELTIEDTIHSLLALDYRIYEIIVVNDGSTDETGERVADAFALHPIEQPIRRQLPCREVVSVWEGSANGVPILLINKENGGKADAINLGINAARYPYFVCMDADSILQRDSLKRIALPVLENQDVVAVGSMIRISNDCVFEQGQPKQLRLPKKLLPAFQVLEYERSFLASRILLNKFNSNLIVSGAFGLFKKEAVIQAGGYQVGSVGEDMELIMKLHSYFRSHKQPYAIEYACDAVCWTQVPERLGDLIRQRRRWHIGLIQSLLGHIRVAGKLSYFYYLFYEMLSPIIELSGILVTILAGFFGLLNPPYMIAFFLVYAVFGALLTVISYLTRNFLSDVRIRARDVVRAFLLCIPETVVIRFLLSWTRLFAILFYRGGKTSWGTIKRYKIDYHAHAAEEAVEQTT